jgi:1-acyl-sn-glycerol-3-phosphate acyltransferase
MLRKFKIVFLPSVQGMRKVLNIIWQFFFVMNFLWWLCFFYWPLKFLFAKESRWKASMKVQRFWAGWLRVSMGVKTIVTYEEPLDPNKTYIYTPNHTNYLDILTGYKIIPNYFHFIAKASLAKVPLFRVMFTKTHIPFDRSSKMESGLAFQRAVKDIEKGFSILVYPEGTQNRIEGQLLPFKPGAFKMAIETNTPIVPVTTLNPFHILPHEKDLFKMRRGGPGKLYIKVGKPIYPEECNYSMEELQEKVYNIVLNNLQEYHGNKR